MTKGLHARHGVDMWSVDCVRTALFLDLCTISTNVVINEHQIPPTTQQLSITCLSLTMTSNVEASYLWYAKGLHQISTVLGREGAIHCQRSPGARIFSAGPRKQGHLRFYQPVLSDWKPRRSGAAFSNDQRGFIKADLPRSGVIAFL